MKVNLMDENEGGTQAQGTYTDFGRSKSTGIMTSLKMNIAVLIKLLLLILPLFGTYIYIEMEVKKKKTTLASIEIETNQVQSELQNLTSEVEAVRKLKEQRGHLLKRIDSIKNLSLSRLDSVKMLEALQTIVPKRLWLTNVKVKNNSEIEFEGESIGDEEVSDFLKSLKESAYFYEVGLDETVDSKNEDGVLKKYRIKAKGGISSAGAH